MTLPTIKWRFDLDADYSDVVTCCPWVQITARAEAIEYYGGSVTQTRIVDYLHLHKEYDAIEVGRIVTTCQQK